MNLAKCEIGKAVVTYLGKQVGQGFVKPIAAKVAAILEFPTPLNKRDLRRFLGMSGYYRGFCCNFSTIVSPLTDLLSTAKSFKWSTECDNAFKAAKDLLCHAPVLSAPNFDLPFKLQVDAMLLVLEQFCCRRIPVALTTQSATSQRSSRNANNTTARLRRRPSLCC